MKKGRKFGEKRKKERNELTKKTTTIFGWGTAHGQCEKKGRGEIFVHIDNGMWKEYTNMEIGQSHMEMEIWDTPK